VQKSNLNGFVKPGELVDMRAGADLSLHDRRIFNLLIEHAWSEIAEDKAHRIAIAKLRGPHKGGERVADSVSALMKTLVEVPTTLEGKVALFKTHLLGDTTQVVDESSPDALLVYKFPEGLRKIIQNSGYWGRIKAHVMFSFSSKYALTLYEALCLRGNLHTHEQVFSVEEFRSLLGVQPGQHKLFKNLKLRVLNLAVTEVNGLSDFTVEIDPIREGGMVRGKLTGFRLIWDKKSADEWKSVMDELLRHRAGRSARLRGAVEAVTL
jgi:hypothetical protein